MRDSTQIKALIESLNSTECPSCQQRKKPRMTLCGGCYRVLPPGPQARLWRHIGDGYEAAVAEALTLLQRMPRLAPSPIASADDAAGKPIADAPGQLFMFDSSPCALAGGKR